MDIKLNTFDSSGDYPVWDISTENKISPILTDEQSEIQDATLACLLERDTIPQLDDVGVDWAGFLTGEKTFGMIDAEIRDSLQKAGFDDFRPEYKIEGDRLTLTVTKEM